MTRSCKHASESSSSCDDTEIASDRVPTVPRAINKLSKKGSRYKREPPMLAIRFAKIENADKDIGIVAHFLTCVTSRFSLARQLLRHVNRFANNAFAMLFPSSVTFASLPFFSIFTILFITIFTSKPTQFHTNLSTSVCCNFYFLSISLLPRCFFGSPSWLIVNENIFNPTITTRSIYFIIKFQ